MPIKPENRSRYPKNWKQIRAAILDRAGNRCEFCGVENHTYRLNPKTGQQARIVLTIAHLDHTPEHCEPGTTSAPFASGATTPTMQNTGSRHERNPKNITNDTPNQPFVQNFRASRIDRDALSF